MFFLLLLFFNGFFSWSLGEVKEMESLLSCCLGAAGGWFKGFYSSLSLL